MYCLGVVMWVNYGRNVIKDGRWLGEKSQDERDKNKSKNV